MTITLKQIDGKINTFTTNRDKLRDLAHEIAALIVYHAAPIGVTPDCQGSGDCTRALKLTKQMPKSWAAQMEAWFKAFTPIRVITKNDKCEYDPAYKRLAPDEKLKAWKVAEAMETPFFELMDEPEVKDKEFDIDALLKALVKRAEKQIEDGKVKPEKLDYTKAVLLAVAGIKVQPAPANDAKEVVLRDPYTGEATAVAG